MRPCIYYLLIASLLLVSACNRNEPPKKGDDQTGTTNIQKPANFTFETTQTLGYCKNTTNETVDLYHEVPLWMRDGFSVMVGKADWRGRKEVGPVFVAITRHPLPKTSEEAANGGSGGGFQSGGDVPDDLMRSDGNVRSCQTHTAFNFGIKKKDLAEDFWLSAGKPDAKGAKYNLLDGRVFLIDVSVDPARIEQVKADVRDMAPNKESCVKLLRELTAKSEIAKSLLEEAQRR